MLLLYDQTSAFLCQKRRATVFTIIMQKYAVTASEEVRCLKLLTTHWTVYSHQNAGISTKECMECPDINSEIYPDTYSIWQEIVWGHDAIILRAPENVSRFQMPTILRLMLYKSYIHVMQLLLPIVSASAHCVNLQLWSCTGLVPPYFHNSHRQTDTHLKSWQDIVAIRVQEPMNVHFRGIIHWQLLWR